MSANWRAAAKAAHTKALGTPQAFALTGDGEATLAVFDGPERDPCLLGPRLADARYRDWQAHGGLFPETRVASSAAPQLTLTGEETVKANGTVNGAKRDREVCIRWSNEHSESGREANTPVIAILRALVDEFGDLFPDEFAAAKRWLAENA